MTSDPHGTCYLSDVPVTGLAEHVREGDVTPAESQEAIGKRCLSQMPLDRRYGRKIADMTVPIAVDPANPVNATTISRPEARPWALAAHRGGFDELLYELSEDPKCRRGLALFWEAGEHEPPNVVTPSR